MKIPQNFRPSAGFSEVLYRTFQKFYTTSTIELLGFRPSAEKESSIVEKKFYIELYLKNFTGDQPCVSGTDSSQNLGKKYGY